MKTSAARNLSILLCLSLLHPMMSPSSFAFARRRSPPKAYSFLTEREKASQAECDGEAKIPRRLKKAPELKKAGGYLGSELQTSELTTDANGDLWKHFFTSKPACNAALAKTPAAAKKSADDKKPELPPEESPDSDDEDPQPDAQE